MKKYYNLSPRQKKGWQFNMNSATLFSLSVYSHLKHFTAIPIQATVTAPITATGSQ